MDFTGKIQIPLNPPLPKGDFNPPFEKGGQGGFFILVVRQLWFMDAYRKNGLNHRGTTPRG